MYFAFKHIHMLCAAISIIGFVIRGGLRIKNSTVLQKKWIRIAPHIVDTLLLLSAIGLMLSIGQYPFVNSWLTAKLIGLLVYIFLGVVTMRIAKTQPLRIGAYLLAIATFFYIASVAITKTPLPL
ncbi:MAG TPA: SirB2 family protein [Spongiibacteraceae bacterium]|nr:SirB2 family protein [Spongiibacteraceae bacterium]